MFLNVRKERVHHCGHSNIDFRSNNSEYLSKFVNARNKVDFLSNINNFMSSTEGTSDNFQSPTNKKKLNLKLPFNDQKKVKKISEAIENTKNIHFEKTLNTNRLIENKNFFFKIISPSQTHKHKKSKNFLNMNNENDKEFYDKEDIDLKVDSVIKDLTASHNIENEFNKNDVTVKSEKHKRNNQNNGDLFKKDNISNLDYLINIFYYSNVFLNHFILIIIFH